jgi:hypothetical protein
VVKGGLVVNVAETAILVLLTVALYPEIVDQVPLFIRQIFHSHGMHHVAAKHCI